MAAIVLIPEFACQAVLAGGSARRALLLLPQYNPQYKQDREELQKIDASLQSETQALRAKAATRNEEQSRTNLDRTAGLAARVDSELAQTTGAAPGATPKLQRSTDLANDITPMRNPHNTVDEQLQNQTPEVSVPGTAYLAEPAVSPPHSANAGVVRNALLPLFGFIGLGLVAAVLSEVARRLRAQGRTVQRPVAENSRVVPEATHVSPVQEIPAPAEPAAAAAVIAAPAAPPARQAAPEPPSPQPSAPQRSVPDRAVLAPPPLPQLAPVVAENRQLQSPPQSSPQPAPAVPVPLWEPAAPVASRDVESVFPWFAGSAPQPALKPPGPIMPSRPRIEKPMPQSASKAPPPPARQPQGDTPEWLMETPPWWMTKTQNYNHPAAEQPRAPRVEAWYAAPAHGGRRPAAAEVREEENLPDELPTRLSALRGIHFSLGVREFSPRKDAARDGYGSGHRAPASAAPFDPGQATVPEVLIPQPEPKPVEAHEPVQPKVEESVARTAASPRVAVEPEFLAPPAEEANKVKESLWNRAGYDTGGDDDIQILPSKRGQYKR
jgi:hypothetical protein